MDGTANDTLLPDAVPNVADFLAGGGKMGALMREFDWSNSALGPPAKWPVPLRVAVQLMLNTNHPMYLFWGADGICLYNDAYSASIGPEMHPSSLGQPARQIWAEIWDVIGPQIDQVMSGGAATWHENHLIPITRNGRQDDVYWTYSFSPIGDDSSANGVGGVLVLCTETTDQVLAEQRLGEQATRQVKLFEKAPGIIAIVRGPDHVFEFANDAYCRLVGRRDLIGKTVAEAIPELSGQGFVELLDTVYSSGQRFVGQQKPTLLRREGEELLEEYLLDFVYEPIRDERGEVTGIFVEGHDVTSRQRAENERREADELNRRLVEGIKGYSVFTTDADNIIVDWTAGAEEIFGWTASEIVGQDAAILFTPEDRANDVPAIELAMARDQGCAEDARWHLKRDGSLFFANGSVRPLHGPDGAISGFVKMARDETARRKAEADLRESEARLAVSEESLRLSTDAADIGTWDLDVSANTLDWSDRTKAMFGISPGVPCSMDDFYAGLHPDDLAATSQAFASALDPVQRAVYDVEYRTIGKEDNVVRWISAKGLGLFDEAGNCIRAIGTAIDITQRKIDENELIASDARFRFLDIVAKAIQSESDPEAVMMTVTRLLGEHLAVDICPYADVEADSDIFHIRRDWTAPGVPSIVGTYSLDDFGKVAADAQRSGVALVTRNAIVDLGEEEASTFTSIGIAATICVPLVKHGRLTAMMAVHSAQPRDWSDHDVTLVTEVAERCWAHIERVGAQAILLASEARLRDVLDNMGEAFVLLDRDYRIVHMNAWAEGMERRPREEVIGKTHWEAHPDAAPEVGELYRKAMTERCAVSLEHRYTRPDGPDTWISMRAFPIDDGLAVFYNDISERKRARAALEESEERFRLIADSAPVPMWVSLRDRTRSFVNAAYLKFLGTSYEEAVCFDWRSIIHPDDHDRIVSESIAGEASLKPFALEGRYRRGDGQWRWLQSNSQPRFDADGVHSGFIGVAHDVTEARQAEAILRESEERFREQFENANDFIFTTDLEMRITSCNPAVAAALEREPDALIGHRISEFTPAETWEHNKAMLSAKLAGKGDVSRYEVQVFNRQGERMTWEINSRLTRDAAGTPTGLHAIGRDVSERIIAERMLDEARIRAEANAAQQAAVLGQLAEGVIITDAGGQIMFVNDAATRLHGVEALGVAPSDYSKTYHLFREDGSPYPSEELPLARAILRGQTARDERWQIHRPDGSQVLAIGNAQPVLGPDGKAIGAVLTVRDDTARHSAELALRELNDTLELRVAERTAELEHAQEALRQSQKLEAMGQLTGGVAHDFNNLLTPILGSLDLLHRRQLGGPREQMLIEGALQSADRAKTLVQRLLAFARRQPLNPAPVDIVKLVDGLSSLLGSTLGPNIRLQIDAASDLPPAMADENQLEMALLNLSVNARDAMPHTGILGISARLDEVNAGQRPDLAPGAYILLAIADNGTGMDRETLARSIEPFFSTKGIGKGTGLGLSMVHGLASQLGGAMTIKSEPGEGTIVSIWLPVTQADSRPVGRPLAKAEPQRFTGTVLLVDDEPVVRGSTADMLTDLGFKVIEADSAENALVLLDRLPDIQLLVTDHLMPGMTGARLAETFLKDRSEAAVLIITGYAEADGIPPELPRLNKPFRQSELSSMLNDLIGDKVRNPVR